jgi:hypothetical protein
MRQVTPSANRRSCFRYRQQRQARTDAKLAAAMLVLMLALAPLSAAAAVALYPVALGETGASPARVADATILVQLMGLLALAAVVGGFAFVAMLWEALRRF